MAGGFSLEKDKIEEFNMFCDSKILELDQDILTKRTHKNMMIFLIILKLIGIFMNLLIGHHLMDKAIQNQSLLFLMQRSSSARL